MLVFQPLQPGGRDVVFERRPRCLGTGSRSGRFSRICQSAMGFRVLVGDPISEGPRLGPDNSSHGERDVSGPDVE